MPSIVSEVSATLVETTTLRPGGPPGNFGPGASLKIFCCAAGGRDEYSGYTSSSPSFKARRDGTTPGMGGRAYGVHGREKSLDKGRYKRNTPPPQFDGNSKEAIVQVMRSSNLASFRFHGTESKRATSFPIRGKPEGGVVQAMRSSNLTLVRLHGMETTRTEVPHLSIPFQCDGGRSS